MFGLAHHIYTAAAPNIATSPAGQAVSGFISGTGSWIAGLGVPAGGLMFAYHAIMRNMSGGDAQVDAHHLAAMKKVAIGTALVVGAGGIAHFTGTLL